MLVFFFERKKKKTVYFQIFLNLEWLSINSIAASILHVKTCMRTFFHPPPTHSPQNRIFNKKFVLDFKNEF